jgi:hypothetical protein
MGHVALIKWNLLHSATESNVRSYGNNLLQKEKNQKRNRQHSKYQNDKLDNQSAKRMKGENDGQQVQRKSKKEDSKKGRVEAKRAKRQQPKGKTNVKQVQTVTFSSPFRHLK